MSRQPTARDAIDEFGIEQICEELASCKTMTSIAEQIGVSKGSLIAWVSAEADRSARVKDARNLAAIYWEEKAEAVVRDAPDEFELKKARELAQHYRWRASKIAPRDYGDKLEVNNVGMPMVVIRDFTGRKNEPADD